MNIGTSENLTSILWDDFSDVWGAQKKILYSNWPILVISNFQYEKCHTWAEPIHITNSEMSNC